MIVKKNVRKKKLFDILHFLNKKNGHILNLLNFYNWERIFVIDLNVFFSESKFFYFKLFWLKFFYQKSSLR